jgi:hypothetical protein
MQIRKAESVYGGSSFVDGGILLRLELMGTIFVSNACWLDALDQLERIGGLE